MYPRSVFFLAVVPFLPSFRFLVIQRSVFFPSFQFWGYRETSAKTPPFWAPACLANPAKVAILSRIPIVSGMACFVPGKIVPRKAFLQKCLCVLFMTRSTRRRDRNLQFRGVVSTGCLNFLQFSFFSKFSGNRPKMWRKLPDFRAEKKS